MGRPKRTTEQQFYDLFAGFPVEEQVVALRIMTELHRQKQNALRTILSDLGSKSKLTLREPETLPLVSTEETK